MHFYRITNTLLAVYFRFSSAVSFRSLRKRFVFSYLCFFFYFWYSRLLFECSSSYSLLYSPILCCLCWIFARAAILENSKKGQTTMPLKIVRTNIVSNLHKLCGAHIHHYLNSNSFHWHDVEYFPMRMHTNFNIIQSQKYWPKI